MTRQPTARRVSPYLIGAASLALAFVLRLVLDPLLGAVQPLTTFYLAIAVTSWFGGLRPVTVVLPVGYIVADWFLIAPRHVPGLDPPS
jgi:K+-sensing histidine kinase KdpD